MSTDPKTPVEPGSRESLGLDKKAPAPPEETPEHVEEEGEPFDGNFA